MIVTLEKANITDCAEIHTMQVKSFKILLDKYKDISTNPGAESIERIIERINQDFTDYYFIKLENKHIGVIRIVRLPNNICRISPIFICLNSKGRVMHNKQLCK